MAVIEICDICRKEVTDTDGITLTCSDMNGLGFFGNDPVRVKRHYKIRICKKCVDNIKKYYKRQREVHEEKDIILTHKDTERLLKEKGIIK